VVSGGHPVGLGTALSTAKAKWSPVAERKTHTASKDANPEMPHREDELRARCPDLSNARAPICGYFDSGALGTRTAGEAEHGVRSSLGAGDISNVGNVHAATPAVVTHAVRRIWVCATAGSASLTVVLCLVHWWVM
jgi:hypothetical protein